MGVTHAAGQLRACGGSIQCGKEATVRAPSAGHKERQGSGRRASNIRVDAIPPSPSTERKCSQPFKCPAYWALLFGAPHWRRMATYAPVAEFLGRGKPWHDSAPGDVNGQGVGDVGYVVDPTGAMIDAT